MEFSVRRPSPPNTYSYVRDESSGSTRKSQMVDTKNLKIVVPPRRRCICVGLWDAGWGWCEKNPSFSCVGWYKKSINWVAFTKCRYEHTPTLMKLGIMTPRRLQIKILCIHVVPRRNNLLPLPPPPPLAVCSACVAQFGSHLSAKLASLG